MGAHEQGADAVDNRWLTIPRTLCFVFNGDEVLLMKRGAQRRVFPNRYNGVGGHIERNEDPLSGAIREIYEEAGLVVDAIRLCGVHHIDAGAAAGIIMFVCIAESQSKEVIQTGVEGSLHWIPISGVLALDLVEDLPFILPRILKARLALERPYFVHVSYDNNDVIQMRFVE